MGTVRKRKVKRKLKIKVLRNGKQLKLNRHFTAKMGGPNKGTVSLKFVPKPGTRIAIVTTTEYRV